MLVFFTGTVSFVVAFAIHVILWRIHVPRHQAASLALLFVAVAIVVLVTESVLDPALFGLSPLRLALAVILFGSFGVVYLILFSALEADSPTLTIIALIQAGGRHGVSEHDLLRAMAGHSFVRLRLDQMVRDGMAVRRGDRLHPSSQGILLASLVRQYRILLCRTHAGG
jgi:hypothetical protein